MAQRGHREPAFLVTTAPENKLEELRARQRRYLWTMGLRVFCFVLAVVLYVVLPGEGGIRFVAAALATVLPWIAVVAANAGPRRRPGVPSTYRAQPPPALESRSGHEEHARQH